MEQKNEHEEHILSIENLSKVTASAIVSVDAFSSNQLVISYSGGKIIICGSQIKITAFSKATGNLCATGNFTGVKYTTGGALKQKLFK